MLISKIVVSLADGQIFSITLDPRNGAHQQLMTTIESVLRGKSFESHNSEIKKFEATESILGRDGQIDRSKLRDKQTFVGI